MDAAPNNAEIPNTQEVTLTPEPTRNKRARPTISCLECRRKKLKCDREKPCMQCHKAGRESGCTYATAPTPSRATDNQSNHDSATNPSIKRPRLEAPPVFSVERGAWEAPGFTSSVPYTDVWLTSPIWRPMQGDQGIGERDSIKSRSESRPSDFTTLGATYIKEERSRYLGHSDRMVMMNHFPDVKSFIITGFKEPDINSMMIEMSEYQKLIQIQKAPHSRSAIPLALPVTKTLATQMLESMPAKYICVLLKETYFLYWENIMRILHGPTFEKGFWEAMQLKSEVNPPPQACRDSTLPQMLAVFALSARLIRRRVTGQDTLSEAQIAMWTELVQRWLEGRTRKELLDMQTLRTQTLLLLVRQNNLAPPSSTWKDSGNLVRSAMIMGLHRDPDEHKGFTPFQAEQRRKLWRTILELDIQLSLSAGMPTSLRSTDFSCSDVKNLDDLDLIETLIELPPHRNVQQWSDSISQISLGHWIKERLDGVNILGGNIDLNRDTSSLLVRAADLERGLLLLPPPVRFGAATDREDEKSAGKLWSKIMLDVHIRRPSLAIYRAIAFSQFSSRFPEARKAAVQSSIIMLSHLDALDPMVADLNTIKDRDLLNLFHAQCKNDIIQASVMLCFEIHRLSVNLELPQMPNGDEVPWTKHSLTRTVENTMSNLTQHIGEFGSDLKDILPVSVLLQYVRSNGSPEDKRIMMRNGAERILNSCRAVLPRPQLPDSPQNSNLNTDVNKALSQDAPSLPICWNDSGNPTSKSAGSSMTASAQNFNDNNTFVDEFDLQNYNFDMWDWDLDQTWN